MSAPAITARMASVDLVRGMAMVLMAIDHVRVYSGVPAGGQTPGVFFTRWATHFNGSRECDRSGRILSDESSEAP